ncbi:hypothetical protein HanRHA438_Chr02g0082331 [Helianthus annuus]|nr:hypothetical protein HanRHA438_Chr02g0082331 [Helianthus annuus]
MWLPAVLGCRVVCACRLGRLQNTDCVIQLEDIDIFWRKLDLNASNIDEEDVDVDKQLEYVKQKLSTQPPQVRKSVLSKIMAVVYPYMSDKKPPVVQENTHGRPTSKVQQQRKEQAARDSSVGPPRQQSRYNPPRHNSYVPSQDSLIPSTSAMSLKSQRKLNRRDHSTSSREEEPGKGNAFPLITDEGMLEFAHIYKKKIPKVFHCYISRIKDVRPDGHCGFRAATVGLGFEQDYFGYIRNQLLEELTGPNKEMWGYIFDSEVPGDYDEQVQRINFTGVGMAPREHWMEMPQAALLLANRFGVIVHILDIQGCSTIFPLYDPKYARDPHQFVSLLFVNRGHFIHVRLEGDYPMPPPNLTWSRRARRETLRWTENYTERIAWYDMLMKPNLDPTLLVID